MKYLKIFILIIISFSINSVLYTIDYLSKDILETIDQSIFEVVKIKPTTDSLTYEKPLPLDLIPYNIRNDKYYSIGTAFAISSNIFASASHVFNVEYLSQNNSIFIRDKNGNVYEADKIIKYSNNKDYILFTVKNITINKTLKINYDPVVNEAVYAVGNAFGEGIIIRNGVFTSRTPEKEKGEWEWLRFSAAASPGNSGGPLLDKDGNIIGIITMKSENENLNYALPIAVVNEKTGFKAIYHEIITYNFINTRKTKQVVYDYKVDLPKKYEDLRNIFNQNVTNFVGNMIDSYFEEFKDSIFPNGTNSTTLLHTTIQAYFPHIISEGEDGNWDAFRPKEINKADLGNNGYINYGYLNNLLLIYLKNPDDISLKDLYTDSKLFMDLILKGITVNRRIMNDNIKIISYGNAFENYFFTDSYKRKWIVRTWQIEYDDSKIVSFCLPVPGGIISIIQLGDTGFINSVFIPTIKKLVDFIYISYYATFKEWNEFLKNKDFLPEIFSSIDFTYNTGSKVSFKSNRLSFSYNNSLLNIFDDSDMKLNFSYYKEGDNIVWDIIGLTYGEKIDNNNYFSIYKQLKPETGLNDSFYTEWEKIYKQQYPYNNKPYTYEGSTFIQSVHPDYSNMKNSKTALDKDYIYVVKFGMEGNISNREISRKIKTINSSIKLTE